MAELIYYASFEPADGMEVKELGDTTNITHAVWSCMYDLATRTSAGRQYGHDLEEDYKVVAWDHEHSRFLYVENKHEFAPPPIDLEDIIMIDDAPHIVRWIKYCDALLYCAHAETGRITCISLDYALSCLRLTNCIRCKREMWVICDEKPDLECEYCQEKEG